MEQWMGDAVGKMHINKITQSQLAERLGVSVDYISMILNGKKTPKDAEKRIMSALNEIIASKS